MDLIFRHSRPRDGQVGHLMPLRLTIFAQQQTAARFTHTRFADHDLVDPIDAQQLARLPWRPALSTPLAATAAFLARLRLLCFRGYAILDGGWDELRELRWLCSRSRPTSSASSLSERKFFSKNQPIFDYESDNEGQNFGLKV